MRLKNLLSILLLLPLMCCCQEDDIEVIFVKSGTWNVGNFCVGGKWDKTNDGAKVIYQKNEDLKALEGALSFQVSRIVSRFFTTVPPEKPQPSPLGHVSFFLVHSTTYLLGADLHQACSASRTGLLEPLPLTLQASLSI